MNKYLRILSALLYILALIFLTLCFAVDISPYVSLVILIFSCTSGYFASLVYAKTLSKDKAQKLIKCTFAAFFVIYIFFLVTLVLFDSYFGRTGASNIPKWTRDAFKAYFDTRVNFVPFKTVIAFITGLFSGVVSFKAFLVNILGNLAAFSPFGFFLPVLFEKQKAFKNFLITMIIIVLSAEILQMLLLTGAFDVDDVILNVGGACMVFGLLRLKYIGKIANAVMLK